MLHWLRYVGIILYGYRLRVKLLPNIDTFLPSAVAPSAAGFAFFGTRPFVGAALTEHS